MKLGRHRQLTRRDLMHWIGGAALALPSLELFAGRSARAQGARKRSRFAVFCYTPNGVNQNAFWLTGTTTNFQLSPILAPFEPFKDRMLILGPEMDGTSPRSGTGLTYCAGCGGVSGADRTPLQHQAVVCLSGRARGAAGDIPYAEPQANAVNRLDGPSIDTVIGEAVKGDSLFANLNFGIHPIGGDTPSDINFAADGTPLKRMATPDEAWNRVFAIPVMGGVASETELRRQTALTSFLHGRFAALTPQLGGQDRQLIDRHLTSLRTYEERRARLLSEGQGRGCLLPARRPVPVDDNSVRTGADTEQLSPFYLDIITAAFACNLAKVASVTFGYPGGGDAGGLRMPWLGFTDPLHGVSHHGNDRVRLDKYMRMTRWIASQIAYLMQKLASIQDVATGKSLLEETSIYWFNRHGDGDSHSNTNLPNLLLGGAGGYFQMGRYLQLPFTNPTRVLISIANAMGVDVPAFGKDIYRDTSALAGLV